ncbi:hypothetical protein CPT_Maja_050 [Burkholderia phage Maja]|uniref:Uncharacterized protein n=1 Tax=Burkholderia phage Maja TaxID=2767571 RepID=A0A7S6U3N4_9CAUD|nr:hypothetical protein CPT_Maja_050 [Burkholderia phage Maja]
MSNEAKVLFYIDNCLGDSRWREFAKANIDRYQELACNDEPNPEVVARLKEEKAAGYGILIASDMAAKFREPLVNWLIRNCELRPGEYQLIDDVDYDVAAYMSGVCAIYTSSKAQCEMHYEEAKSERLQLFLIENGKVTDYRAMRVAQDAEYERLNGAAEVVSSEKTREILADDEWKASFDGPEVSLMGNAASDGAIRPESPEDVPQGFRSPVANKVVVVYVPEDGNQTIGATVTRAMARLIREGFPIAVITNESRKKEREVTEKIRAIAPEALRDQVLIAFRDEDTDESKHFAQSLIDIEKLMKSNNGTVAAVLSNVDEARAYIDLFIGGVAATTEEEVRDMVNSLASVARVARGEPDFGPSTDSGSPGPSGGRVNYYLVRVDHPQREEQPPYQAECEDIIAALNMTFDEGCEFKAIWRTAAARLGNGKQGHDALYDAQKRVHYATRCLKAEERKKHLQQS